VAFVVKADEAGDPLEVALFRAAGVVADAEHLADLVEQARRSWQGQFAQVHVQHGTVEEVDGVAGGGEGAEGVGVGPGDGVEELADLGQAHLTGMAFPVEEDEATGPIDEGVDGGFGMAVVACGLAEMVEQAGWLRGWRGRRRGRGVRVHEALPVAEG
jgi:hypothetical protein